MSEVNEESFEYRLDSLGRIDRCDVACGSYGDKFQRWDDAGHYVEYEDHVKHVSFYAAELAAQRLRADTAEAELKATKEGMAYRGSLFGKVQSERDDYERKLAAALNQKSEGKAWNSRATNTVAHPVAWLVEVDGMTLYHREPMDHPRAKNVPLFTHPVEVAALQSNITPPPPLKPRIAELESKDK